MQATGRKYYPGGPGAKRIEVQVKEKDLPVASPFLVLALPIFPCRQSIVPAELGPELHIIICKKSACRWQADFLCWRYLSSCVGKVLSRRSRDQKPFVEFVNEKDLPVASPFLVLALPIFPCSHPQSIVGEGELNFCVRDGNRWTLTPINTNFVDAKSALLRFRRSLTRPSKTSPASLHLLSKSQTLRWFVILSSRMYPEN